MTFFEGTNSANRFVVVCLQAALILVFNLAPFAHANPSGEQVAAGSAEFDRSGSTLTINTSDQVIINWIREEFFALKG